MGRKIKKLFEKDLEWGFKDKDGVKVYDNRIKVVVYSDYTFIIIVRDYVQGYADDISSFVGNLGEAVELRNTLDRVIEILREEG